MLAILPPLLEFYYDIILVAVQVFGIIFSVLYSSHICFCHNKSFFIYCANRVVEHSLSQGSLIRSIIFDAGMHSDMNLNCCRYNGD